MSFKDKLNELISNPDYKDIIANYDPSFNKAWEKIEEMGYEVIPKIFWRSTLCFEVYDTVNDPTLEYGRVYFFRGDDLGSGEFEDYQKAIEFFVNDAIKIYKAKIEAVQELKRQIQIVKKQTVLFMYYEKLEEIVENIWGGKVEFGTDMGCICLYQDEENDEIEDVHETLYKHVGELYKVKVKDILSQDGDQDFPHGDIMIICEGE